MTVIAWDGRSVAADSLVTFGGYISPNRAQKIILLRDFAYGITGFCGWFHAWIAWHEAGADPAKTPDASVPPDRSGNFLVFQGQDAFCCSKEMPYLQKAGAPDAWGAGCDFAIGAMRAGADARRAVEIAVACSSSCGGEIDAIDLSEWSYVVG